MLNTLSFLGRMSVCQSDLAASAMAASFSGVGLSPTMRRMSSSSQNFHAPHLSRPNSFFDAL